MAINRSTQFFTLDGLTVFKEKVLKNYFKLNEKDAYINGVIYNAMMQYKRDIVKFCASQRTLPAVGNPGTLYMVPSHVDNPQYKPASNEIWVTSTNGFGTMRFKSNKASKYVDMPKNEYGFFVLDLNKVPSWTGYNYCYFHESEETNTGTNDTAANKGSTRDLYKPNITGVTTSTSGISSFAQLYELGGKIIAVNEGKYDVNVLPLPQLYTGNGTDIRISRNLSEIWISAPYDGEYLTCSFGYGQILNIHRNAQGFYVLNLGDIISHKVSRFCVDKPGNSTSYSMYVPGSNSIEFSNYNQLVELAGKILAVTLGTSGYTYDRETAILPKYTYTEEVPVQYTVPDDEVWVVSDNETLTVRAGTYQNTIDTKNEYGFFVLKKNVHLPTNYSGYLYIDNEQQLYINTSAFNHTVIASDTDINALYGHIVIKNSGSYASNLFIVQPYDNSETDIITNIASGITIPSDEVWIDSANWPTLQIVIYNSSTRKYLPIEVTKNEYGYYVLHQSDLSEYSSSSDYLYCCTKDVDLIDFSNTNYTKYKSYDLTLNDHSLHTSNIFTYAGGRRIVACILSSYVDIIPDTLPIVAYTGANSDRFVTYAYENGKYVTLGNTVFSEKEYPIDSNLDANSLHTVYNSTIYKALQDKYDVANILDEVDGTDTKNTVTSRGIQAALAPKLGWDDLRNITLYQLMRELRFPWNMPTEMYFKLVVYAPLKEQDLAIFYPTLTQRLQFYTYGDTAFVSTDNKFTYSDYAGTRSKYIDNNTNDEIWLQNQFDISMYSSINQVILSGSGKYNLVAISNSDIQFTITSENPVNMNTLANLSYKFRAYSSNESSTHSHINKIYVSTYLSPDGVDWHTLQNKTIYKWDDNYEELNDYIYLIPILA